MNKQQGIQILRIVACCAVFMVHVGQRLELHGGIRYFTDLGAMGVYLFFVISGYLCFASFEKNAVKVKLSQYYSRRLARILPVYYAVILYQFILHTYILGDVPPDEMHLGWLRYIFCTSTVIPAYNNFWHNLNAVWTIPVFLFFYLLAPLLYKYIRSYNAALIGWVITYFISFYLNRYLPGWFDPIKQLHFFLFGIVIYYIIKEKVGNQLVLFLVINLLFIVFFKGDGDVNVWTVIFGLLVIGSKDLVIKQEFLRRLIDIVDEYTYSIYLVHATVMEYIDRWRLSHTGNWKIQACFIILVQTTIGIILVHNLIEKPIYKLAVKCAKPHEHI